MQLAQLKKKRKRILYCFIRAYRYKLRVNNVKEVGIKFKASKRK